MPIELNIDNSLPNQIVSFPIEGEVFYFHVRWNYRLGWVMSIYDSNSDPSKDSSIKPLLGGLKCMPNGPMTNRYSRTEGLFEGEIVIVDVDGSINGEVTRDNFGNGLRFIPIYFTKEELETLAEG